MNYRDRLGVITQALFAQRDFTDKSILTDFYESLEIGLRSQLTESGLYMGTSLYVLSCRERHCTHQDTPQDDADYGRTVGSSCILSVNGRWCSSRR
jgi:hypothetical protein